MDYKKTYEAWLSNPYFDADTKKELESMAGMKMKSKSVFMRTLSLVQPVSVELSGQEQTV